MVVVSPGTKVKAAAMVRFTINSPHSTLSLEL
jgi:hypothetical protein